MQLNKYISVILVACITITQNTCGMNLESKPLDVAMLDSIINFFSEREKTKTQEKSTDFYQQFIKIKELITNSQMMPAQEEAEWEELTSNKTNLKITKDEWKTDWYFFNDDLKEIETYTNFFKINNPQLIKKTNTTIKSYITKLNRFITARVVRKTKLKQSIPKIRPVETISKAADTATDSNAHQKNTLHQNTQPPAPSLPDASSTNVVNSSNLIPLHSPTTAQNSFWFVKKFLAASVVIGIPGLCAVAYYYIVYKQQNPASACNDQLSQ